MLQLFATVVEIVLIAGISCVALTFYWLARGFLWDRQNRERAIRNAKFDAILALIIMSLIYALAAVNARYCWIDGTAELPGMKYRCVDGVQKKHWSEYDWDKG